MRVIAVLIFLLFIISCRGVLSLDESYDAPIIDIETESEKVQEKTWDQGSLEGDMGNNHGEDSGVFKNEDMSVQEKDVEDKPKANEFLTFVSGGSRCLSGRVGDFVVLSDTAVSCSEHAHIIDTFSKGGKTPGYVVLDRRSGTTTQNYCYKDRSKGCEDLSFEIDVNGNMLKWVASIGGKVVEENLIIGECDYDLEVVPPVRELPASNISITEISIYQGVKIYLYENGKYVQNRNAPVISKRPGVIRVFLKREGNWGTHEILARLRIGNLTKEVRFSPKSDSVEADKNTTINFDFGVNELPNSGEFSVELLEEGQCNQGQGNLFTPTAPSTPKAFNGTKLRSALKVVLVPMIYNADGSGRVPRLDAARKSQYRKAVEAFYPVHEVDLQVRNPVAYNAAIFRNGSGYSEALNYCLNVRNNDKVSDDVYYYCLFQPEASFGSYCGVSCVTGLAPVPEVSDSFSRAGMGIGFDDTGSGTFAHELGHLMGRPHSPCGGASGADPAYPYQGGIIGSIGYSIHTGALVSPNEKDFMGYCEPKWVSDYTYTKIYQRLQVVLGIQNSIVNTSPVTWRTAIYENGVLRWDIDRRLRALPGGKMLNGVLIDGVVNIDEVEVYATSLADMDSMILVIEDKGKVGMEVGIPGIGRLIL